MLLVILTGGLMLEVLGTLATLSTSMMEGSGSDGDISMMESSAGLGGRPLGLGWPGCLKLELVSAAEEMATVSPSRDSPPGSVMEAILALWPADRR